MNICLMAFYFKSFMNIILVLKIFFYGTHILIRLYLDQVVNNFMKKNLRGKGVVANEEKISRHVRWKLAYILRIRMKQKISTVVQIKNGIQENDQEIKYQIK